MGALRFPLVPGIKDVHILPVGKIQRVGRVGQAGPAQHHLGLGPHAAQPLDKGIDGRRHTVHGVCRHIAHVGLPGCDARRHPQQKRHLIGAGVVGAHQRVRHIQAAVQKLRLGVLGRHLQAGGVHPGAGGKHDVRIVMGHVLHHLLGVHLRVHVLPAAHHHPVRERFFQRLTALFLPAHPGAGLPVVLVQEHHLQRRGLGAEDVQAAQQRFAARLGRLQLQLHRPGVRHKLDLLPDLCQILPHLAGGGLAGVRVAEHREVHQQRIPRRQPQRRAAQRVELLAEHGVQRQEIQSVVVGPLLLGGFARQRLQLGVAAQPGKMHIVDLGELIKIQKLVVDAVFQRVILFRDEPGHHTGDLHRLVILEDGNPLVALLHIKLVHVLVGQDGVVDALLQMRVAQVDPLVGKLGALVQQRHKVGGKGRVPPRCLGAHDAFRRDLHQPQRLLGRDLPVGQKVVQHRQVGRLPLCLAGTAGPQARPLGVAIIF